MEINPNNAFALIPKVSSVCILLLVWSTFCNSFYNKVTADAGSIIVTIVTMILLYLFYTALCIGVSLLPFMVKGLRLDRSDSVAIAMWVLSLMVNVPANLQSPFLNISRYRY